LPPENKKPAPTKLDTDSQTVAHIQDRMDVIRALTTAHIERKLVIAIPDPQPTTSNQTPTDSLSAISPSTGTAGPPAKK
jgi:hypothetical protein